MANQNYGEVLCQAVDEIVRKRLEGISYDQTVLCTIVNNDKHEQGIYTVTNNGRVKFEAVSENTSYRVNDNVYVQIPGGDWDQQKMIIAKKADKNAEESFVYRSPFESLVDITGNMINSKISSKGLIANSEKPEFKTKTLWTYTSEKTEEESDDIQQEIRLPLSSYTRLGIKAEFKSLITPFYQDNAVYNVNTGDYGLRLILTVGSDQTVNGDALGDQEYELYLNCADMNGNPYNFQSYYTQEKIFDITNIGTIKSLKLEFYQATGSFGALNSDGQTEAAVPATDFLGNDLLPNLFVNDPYISLGYDTSEFNTDMVYVYSLDSTTYSREVSNDVNHKEVQLRWVHKDEKKDFISIGLDDKNMDYEIRWYRYELGHKSVDGYAGVYWKEFAIQRRIPENDDDKVSAESTWNDTENDWQYIIRDKDWLAYNANVEDEKKLYPDFFKVHLLPDITLQNEQIKAIILYKNQPYRSNTVVFENQNEVVNKATIDAVSALSVVCVDKVVDGVEESTYGNYRIYGQNGSLLNYADSKVVRKFVPYFKLSGGNSDETPTELIEAESIEWIIPTKKTMIVIDEDNLPEPDADGRVHIIRKPAEGSKDISAINYQNYRIKSYYSQSYNDNTIQCKIVKNNVTYTCTKELTFGTAGTSGTDCTFILDFDNGVTALTIGDSAAVTVTARLYDYENKEIENLGGREVKWSWKTDDGKMQFPGNAAGKAPTQEIKLTDGATIGASYNILSATIEWGDGTLTAYLPIPIRASTEYAYISGTTQVIYNSAGELLDCFANPYIMYKNDTTIASNVIWECQNKYQNESAYTPKVITDTKDNQYLQPLSFYVENACKEVCVICKLNDNTIWSQPLLIMQNRYASAMLNQWDGKLKIDEEGGSILAPRMAAGMKHTEDGTFSGVVLGNWGSTNSDNSLASGETGLYGFDHGEQSYGFKQDGTAFIGKPGAGRIEFKGDKGIIKSSNYKANQGMSINLKDGTIDAHQFELKAGHTTWDSETKNYTDNGITMTTDSEKRPLSIGSNFSVEWDGTLNAAAGKFTGEINATSGKFTGTIESSKITGSTIISSYIANSDENPTFSVNSGGHLIAKSAVIGGWYVRPTTTNGQYSLYSKDDDFELNPNSGALKMKNITIDGTSGKITLGPNKDVVIDGTYKEITLGTGATATVVTSTGLATSTISIYSEQRGTNADGSVSFGKMAGKIKYMTPEYGGAVSGNTNNQPGIGFTNESSGGSINSVLKLSAVHVGAAYLSGASNKPYWTLDNNGFRAAITGNNSYLTIKNGEIMLGYYNKTQGSYIELTTNSIDLGYKGTSSLKILSNGKTQIQNLVIPEGGTCEGLYIYLE